MNEIALLYSTGKNVLSSLQEFNLKKGLDDTEYLPVVKATINGIKTQAVQLDLPIEKIDKLIKDMIDYSKMLYVEIWVSNGEIGENKEQAAKDGEYYFDYVYEHENHPR